MKKNILADAILILILICSGCAFGSAGGASVDTEAVRHTEKEDSISNEKQDLTLGDQHVCSVTELGGGIVAFITENQERDIFCEIVNTSENQVLAKITDASFDRNMTVRKHNQNLVLYTSSNQVFVVDDTYAITDTIDMTEYATGNGFSYQYIIDPIRKKKNCDHAGGNGRYAWENC